MKLEIFSILALLALLIVVFSILRKRTGKTRFYKPKGPYILSAGEKAFFDVLSQCIDETKYICPKVRIADLVTLTIDRSDKEYWPKLNQITQKHVDFVICNRSDFHPLLVIELDGGSHLDAERQKRDVLVDEVFKEASIPILHVPARSTYVINELKALITSSINLK